jgi:uncharacterized protein involved in tolerance to divalent cations
VVSSGERRKKLEAMSLIARNVVTGKFQYCFEGKEICEDANLALLGTSKNKQLKNIQKNIMNPSKYTSPTTVKRAVKRDHAWTYIKCFMTSSCECCPAGQGKEELDVKVSFT